MAAISWTDDKTGDVKLRVIKKYPNRRLYDTEKSTYITLAQVHEIVRSGVEFKVVDADSGEDITRTILVQIIIEQENGASPIFTTDMLTKFIRVYDDAAQGVFGELLERNMQIFSEQQKRFQQQVMEATIDNPVARAMQDMTERNLAMWQDMQAKFFDLATAGIKTPASAEAETPEDDKPRKKGK